jgi:hypothetical protein
MSWKFGSRELIEMGSSRVDVSSANSTSAPTGYTILEVEKMGSKK